MWKVDKILLITIILCSVTGLFIMLTGCCNCPHKDKPLNIEFRGDSLEFYKVIDVPVNNKEIVNEK